MGHTQHLSGRLGTGLQKVVRVTPKGDNTNKAFEFNTKINELIASVYTLKHCWVWVGGKARISRYMIIYLEAMLLLFLAPQSHWSQSTHRHEQEADLAGLKHQVSCKAWFGCQLSTLFIGVEIKKNDCLLRNEWQIKYQMMINGILAAGHTALSLLEEKHTLRAHFVLMEKNEQHCGGKN